MSFERMPGPSGPEPAPLAATGVGPDASREALRLQVLATEHWGLLATRSMVWNEMFARAGMFLTTLTGGVVALALVAQATQFSTGFLIFALAILAVELFIGFASVVRMGKANYYDALCVVGMNRIRHAYMQLTPEVEPFLVMGTHDDIDSINVSSGDVPGASMAEGVLVSSTFVISVITALVGAAIAAVIAQLLEAAMPWAVAAGVAGFVAVFGLESWFAYRDISTSVRNYQPMFPTPHTPDPEAPR
jgi:hypothetical protein